MFESLANRARRGALTAPEVARERKSIISQTLTLSQDVKYAQSILAHGLLWPSVDNGVNGLKVASVLLTRASLHTKELATWASIIATYAATPDEVAF